MKLVSLNIWGGRLCEPLKDFFQTHTDIDIFCLQEVYAIFAFLKEKRFLYDEIQNALGNYRGHFAPIVTYPSGDTSGLAMFVKNDIEIENEGNIFVFKDRLHYKSENDMPIDATNHPRSLQYAKIKAGGKNFLIANLHGLWNPAGKIDLPERLEQSRKIRGFLDKIGHAKILCGDFNLLPDTESLKILETGMKNLIKEYRVSTTRSHFYEKSDKFADYVLASPEIGVKDFKVLPDAVSDHLPLMLEFD